jgi:TonB family protein
MNKWISLAVVSVLLSPLLSATDAREQKEAINKLKQAVSRTNIFGLPSFRLTANVKIENQGNPLEGAYRLLRNGPEQWREEISLAGYSEVQVGRNGKVWIQRSTDFVPLAVHQLHVALGFGSVAGVDAGSFESLVQLGFMASDRVKKLHSRKEHGDRFTCVETENEQKSSSELCVNDRTGILFRGTSYLDRDFQPIGEKTFPRSLSLLEKGKPVITVNVTALVAPGEFAPDSFTPLTGVTAEAGCMNPRPYRRVRSVAPQYPQDARQQRVEGTVVTDVWIGVDGVPRIRKTLASPSASLEKATAISLTGWRYEPAACDGGPVQVETILRVSYVLSP